MNKSLLEYCMKDKSFEEHYSDLLAKGIICPFNDGMFDKMKSVKINDSTSVYDYFNHGINIGTCGASTVLLSLLFDDFAIVDGKMNFLEGSVNSPNGEHTWLEIGNLIYDTSLGIVIPENIPFGYMESTRILKRELMDCEQYETIRTLNRKKENIDPQNKNIKGVMEYLFNTYLDKKKSK